MNYAEALAYLDDHASYERTGRITAPTTERIERLVMFTTVPFVPG